jgi:acyl-CoA reductase-like NAD-dependent aldehyde dehydrogenase
MLLRNLIAGEWVEPTGTGIIDVVDPATEAVVGHVPQSSARDVSDAVTAARAAGRSWDQLGAHGRAKVLIAGAQAALAQVGELARLQCAEMGQPWAVARPLTEQAILGIQAAAEAATSYPFVTALDSPGDARTSVVRVPRGVGALITPWNFPLPVALDGLVTLLAGGNTVVWKPSERSPLSAVRVAELLDLPPGVLNVVVGNGAAGQALSSHHEVDIVVFTGSLSAGRDVARRCAERFCPVLLELGGKDPVVIDADVDPRWAAEVVAHGAFWNSGQVCTSMERIYVHQEIAAEFVQALKDVAAGLVVGSPLDPTTQIGPLAGNGDRRRVEEHLADAVAGGACIEYGGHRLPGAGYFFAPTVVTGLAKGMLLHDEETFGPVAGVAVVESFHEGLIRAGDSAYGLCATLLTGNPEHAECGRQLPAAVCWTNEWQGGAVGATYEPTGLSGQGTAGTLDTVTRAMTLHRGPMPASAGRVIPLALSSSSPSLLRESVS